ncbi:hypothetical protein [Moraxella sp. CTOTU49803]|uniref:hypothetical protein n=1 Tax=Moraxella sp. CTOTU49803 TaxID=2953840 RepID=UPI0028B0AACA|nr:hypothetical protein [Moraxella sp. CTOTU49803]
MVHSLSTLYRSWAFKVTTWLILAAIAGGLTVTVWIASAVKPAKSAVKAASNANQNQDPTALLLAKTPEELNTEVRPIKFDAVIRDMRNYPKEFKDSRFIKANNGKWTVQVMNVVEHEVVTDYLNSRDDRDKFNYFRIVDAHNQKRFVVTYGVFGSVQEAVGAAKVVNFNLPKEVKAFPEEFKMYAPQMDEYEVAPPLRDVGKTAAREVKLTSTPKLLPAPKAKVERQPQAATSTAVEPKRVAPKASIEKSANPQETLSIQEGKVIAESDNHNASNAPRSEPKVINSKNDNADVKPKQTHSKPAEEKPKSKEASKDSMGELIKQKSQTN